MLVENETMPVREIAYLAPIEEKIASYVNMLDRWCDVPSNDPAKQPIMDLIRNQFTHVSYSFRIARDSDDYPYELHDTEPYPLKATIQATSMAERFFDILENKVWVSEDDLPRLDPEYKTQAIAEQQEVVDRLMADPMAVYTEFKNRRAEFGDDALFPELSSTLKALYYDLVNKPEVEAACEKSPILRDWRLLLAGPMTEFIEDCTYKSSLWFIEETLAFFDLAVRVNDPASPPPYHSARFGYNWSALTEDPELTVLPTMASVTAFDLLKFRSVPVGIIGVSTDTLTVDGFAQTPYEFFYHDVDHTRRMHEATMAAVEREGVTSDKFAQDATDLLHNILLPAVNLDGITDETEYDRRVAMRMILFEILHEDGLDPTMDTIADAILRAPMERTPFEQVVEDNVIEHFMAPRATTLAHVFRKLAHTFYDNPDRRSKTLGSDFVRSRLAIAQGAADLYRMVSDDPIADDSLLTTCQDMVSTDEGFTDAFIGNIAHDIARQAVGQKALSMMISRPLGVHAAVRKTRQRGGKVHSLFGYSALEYEDPELLEQTVVEHLSKLDPSETTIAIGATPYGIGRLYPVVKELGFYTLGIVASTAIGKNESCAEGVDELVVVKDMGWGGYKYAQSSKGLLSPTTRVFVGASDSIAAYGGGNITAVTLEEMQRREKAWTFTPFDMNHRIADMMHAQKGGSGQVDYAGPAYAKWLELNKD